MKLTITRGQQGGNKYHTFPEPIFKYMHNMHACMSESRKGAIWKRKETKERVGEGYGGSWEGANTRGGQKPKAGQTNHDERNRNEHRGVGTQGYRGSFFKRIAGSFELHRKRSLSCGLSRSTPAEGTAKTNPEAELSSAWRDSQRGVELVPSDHGQGLNSK